MKLDQLKKGFWGYKKASVYEYITMMEEEFSEKAGFSAEDPVTGAVYRSVGSCYGC